METNIVLVCLLACQLLLAGWLMWRRPYNPLSIVGTLTALFSYLPAVLLVNGSGFQSYSWRSFTLLDVANAGGAAILIGVLNLCLLVGAAGAEQLYGNQSTTTRNNAAIVVPRGEYLQGSTSLAVMTAVYFILWLVAAVVLFGQSGQTITEFLAPIKKTGIASEQSGYLRSIYLAIPSALVVMSYWRHGKLRMVGWMWVILALVATFSTHQRRELITTALLLLSLRLFLGSLRTPSEAQSAAVGVDTKKTARNMRLSVIGALLAGLLLVPVLWYARVYFTTSDQGSDVDVFEIRSFTDILLGSPTTGFPTFVYIQNFVDNYGTDALYLLAYPLTIFVPRALWDSKPLDLDTVLQNQYGLLENPSSFWYGEMYYGLGNLAIVATPILAFATYRFCLRCQSAPDLWYRTLGALLFMQCVTLFKNGVTVFMIRTLVLVFFLGLAWLICRPRQSAGGAANVEKRHGARV